MLISVDRIAQVSAPPSSPLNRLFFLPSAIGVIGRSTILVSGSILPSSSRKRVSPPQWPSGQSIAFASVDFCDSPSRTARNRACRAVMIGRLSDCRAAWRASAALPRIRFSIA